MGVTQGVPEAVTHSLGWFTLYDPVQYCFLLEAFSKPEIHIPGWLKKKKNPSSVLPQHLFHCCYPYMSVSPNSEVLAGKAGYQMCL